MSIQLAPEVEDVLREEAAARGISIDHLMQEALDLYRRSQPQCRIPAVYQANASDRRRETAWANHPDPQFYGEWVALEGDHVVAHGTDGKAVYETAKSQGSASPFLFFVSEPDPHPFAGGWLGVE